MFAQPTDEPGHAGACQPPIRRLPDDGTALDAVRHRALPRSLSGRQRASTMVSAIATPAAAAPHARAAMAASLPRRARISMRPRESISSATSYRGSATPPIATRSLRMIVSTEDPNHALGGACNAACILQIGAFHAFPTHCPRTHRRLAIRLEPRCGKAACPAAGQADAGLRNVGDAGQHLVEPGPTPPVEADRSPAKPPICDDHGAVDVVAAHPVLGGVLKGEIPVVNHLDGGRHPARASRVPTTDRTPPRLEGILISSDFDEAEHAGYLTRARAMWPQSSQRGGWRTLYVAAGSIGVSDHGR